jgi:hypothetical protein
LHETGSWPHLAGFGIDASVVLQADGAFLCDIGYLGILDHDLAIEHHCHTVAYHCDIHRVPLADGLVASDFGRRSTPELRRQVLVVSDRPQLA